MHLRADSPNLCGDCTIAGLSEGGQAASARPAKSEPGPHAAIRRR